MCTGERKYNQVKLIRSRSLNKIFVVIASTSYSYSHFRCRYRLWRTDPPYKPDSNPMAYAPVIWTYQVLLKATGDFRFCRCLDYSFLAHRLDRIAKFVSARIETSQMNRIYVDRKKPHEEISQTTSITISVGQILSFVGDSSRAVEKNRQAVGNFIRS